MGRGGQNLKYLVRKKCTLKKIKTGKSEKKVSFIMNSEKKRH